MKKIEQLLKEYKIRFRDTEKIKEEGYPFINADFSKPNDDEIIITHGLMYNKFGKVYCSGKWATADLKEKPDMWVVKKDEQHPVWEKFKEWWKKEFKNEFYVPNYRHFFASDGTVQIKDIGLLYFKNYQYLTLDQWAEFFLDEPKVGDFGFFYDKPEGIVKRIREKSLSIGYLRIVNKEKEFPYIHGVGWKYFYKLDLNKPVQPQLDAFIEKYGKEGENETNA